MTTRHTPATSTGDRTTPACHYDRETKTRVIRVRRPDDQGADPDELIPCEQPHCVICQREHTTHAQPLTCPTCIGEVRRDLEDIRWLARHLRWQAARGDGLAVPSARIPGGDAMVVMARAGADGPDLIWSPDLNETHRPDDVVPLLLPLVSWEHQWRAHFGHTARSTDRAPVTAITHYLADHLNDMAQAGAHGTAAGPDWPGFAADITALRRQLEAILHDEHEPDRGVPCFECDRPLVRRFGDPRPCRHTTPARAHLVAVEARAAAGRAILAAIASYPELRGRDYPHGWTPHELAAARPPSTAEISAARRPCDACAGRGQGGIEDPSVGQSWECLGCRRRYTPGEYAHAVRRHLLTSGPNGDGWTHITMAAEAASTQTGAVIAPGTVRKWMDTGKVRACCRWSSTVDGKSTGRVPAYDEPAGRGHAAVVRAFAGRVQSVRGLALVYWPDVADRAADLVVRQAEVERARRERAEQARRFYAALAAKGITKTKPALALGKSMGIHPNRVRAFLDELDAAREKETA
ncbi:hypothetical protein [Nocardioides soli]|uniref:Uncharacterized protein n=1 Tax=Nocardioides soli TaxID=1036020 RepID=A0A7W4VTR5_9ACTN|nr:hypothetical protein [Nocardioides soli]MBB3041204.1 hypothetical protein [Nocardioides soli]